MPRVRCPRCNAVIQAMGDSVSCSRCGLSGRVASPAAAPRPAREPWTFTVDLRKLSPARWSSGSKAMAMVLLLAGVFVAGGLSGVAFEKARSDIARDLDDSFFSDDRTDSLSDSDPADPAGPTDPVAPADPVDSADPAAPPTDSTSGPNSSQTDPPPQSYEGITGQGSQVKGPFQLSGGLVQAIISYHGDTKFFTVRLNLSSEAKPALSWGASDSGSVSGVVRFGSTAAAGQYYLYTNAAEGETWEVDLLVPDREPLGSAFSKTGNGDGGLGPYAFGGSHQVSFDTAAPWTYDVHAYDETGKELACGIRYGGPGAESTTCTVPNGTLVYFDVKIKRSDDGWRLTAQST